MILLEKQKKLRYSTSKSITELHTDITDLIASKLMKSMIITFHYS